MNIQVSSLAIAKLTYLLYEEKTDDPLAIRVIPLTTGCSTPSFALELTEMKDHEKIKVVEGIPFIQEHWLDGLEIDLSRTSGRFSIYHPNPPFADCPIDEGS